MANKRFLTVFSAALTTFVLGSVHAYSVLLGEVETKFSVTRDEASIAYSLALGGITLAVLVGHRIFAKLLPYQMIAFVAALSATGIGVCLWASDIWVFWLGYGAIFGFANGLGYGYCLQLGARAVPNHQATAMGVITAAYALGATLFPSVFSSAIASGGFASALLTLAYSLFGVGILASVFLWLAGASFDTKESENSGSASGNSSTTQVVLWCGYGSGAIAGLMIIGHAYPVLLSMELSVSMAILGTTLLALGNMLGGLAAGFAGDRLKPAFMLICLPAVSALATLGLIIFSLKVAIIGAMTLIGFCYGALIVAYPSTVAAVFGLQHAPIIYGRVFTAWGLAGIVGPWLAGKIYDVTNGYGLSLTLAVGLSIFSSSIIYVFRKSLTPQTTQG